VRRFEVVWERRQEDGLSFKEETEIVEAETFTIRGDCAIFEVDGQEVALYRRPVRVNRREEA
jgi:hypothetical protein